MQSNITKVLVFVDPQSANIVLSYLDIKHVSRKDRPTPETLSVVNDDHQSNAEINIDDVCEWC